MMWWYSGSSPIALADHVVGAQNKRNKVSSLDSEGKAYVTIDLR